MIFTTVMTLQVLVVTTGNGSTNGAAAPADHGFNGLSIADADDGRTPNGNNEYKIIRDQ